jgi:hypothetical protein
VFGFFVVGMNKGGKNARRYSAVFGVIALALLVVSCGGGSPKQNPTTGTPPGTSSITVTATSGASHSAPLSITVTP